jgi:hypothetical protein
VHFSLPLQGRFKARSQEMQPKIIDIASEKHSGLKPSAWARWLISSLETCDIVSGWEFQRSQNAQHVKMSEFAEPLFNLLLEIKKDQTDISASDIDVLEPYGIS